jgi:hypothetical protein
MEPKKNYKLLVLPGTLLLKAAAVQQFIAKGFIKGKI